jgi:hypothetical protein
MQCNTLSHEMDLKSLYKPETRGIPSQNKAVSEETFEASIYSHN